jgi:biopolymer transport protein TolR
LETNSRVQSERELYIRADKNARYGIVAEVVAAARLAGVQSLNLLVEPEIEEVAEPSPGAAPKKGAPPPSQK